jgi:hypothetical protein
MKKIIYSLLPIAVMVFTAITSFAASFPPPPPPPPAPTPIDGGILLMVTGGIGYVAKKQYDKRKK